MMGSVGRSSQMTDGDGSRMKTLCADGFPRTGQVSILRISSVHVLFGGGFCP